MLRVLSEHPEGMTVSELADVLGTHRAGIYRLLAPHLAERLVRRREDRYLLGTGLVELASRVQPRLREVAGPLLQALADELTATAALTVRDGEDAAVVLDVRSPRHADMHITYRPGLRHPVAIAASGIAILAGGPPRPSERRRGDRGARARMVAVDRESCCPAPRGWRRPPGTRAAVSAVWIGDRDEPAMARAVIATARALAERSDAWAAGCSAGRGMRARGRLLGALAGVLTGASRSTWGLVASSARTFSRPASLSGARGSRAWSEVEQAELLHHPLDRHRVGLGEGGVDERVQVVVQRARAFVVAGDERVVELGHRIGREVAHAGQVAGAAEGQHRVAEQLDARERDEVRAGLVEHVGDVLEVAGGLLDADDVGVRAAQPPDRGRA